MQLKNEISQAVLDMIARNDIVQQAQLNAPEIGAENLYPICKHLFSARAQIYLERPTSSLIHQYNKPQEPKAALLGLLWQLMPSERQQEIITKASEDKSVVYVRDFDVVEFVGSTCEPQDIHKAVEKVVSTVNHFADKGFMKVALQPLCMIRFAQLPGEKAKIAIMSYISLTKEGSEYAKTYKPKMMFLEGGIPQEVTNQ